MQNGIEHVIDNVDTLVFAVGYYIDPAMEEMLKACGNKYHLIGDCNKVGNIKDAICQAYEVCKDI